MPLVQIDRAVANLDLFDDAAPASSAAYSDALAAWLTDAGRAGQLQRESSVAVYEHMWSALACWAVENGVRLDNLTAGDLTAYLTSRGGADELSARYAWRLLRLVDRVQVHRAHAGGLKPNRSADELLARAPGSPICQCRRARPAPRLPAGIASQAIGELLVGSETGPDSHRPRMARSSRSRIGWPHAWRRHHTR